MTGQYWGKVLVWVRKACCKYWWMVVTFEWMLSNFQKLFTICSHKSLLEILLACHNGVIAVQWLLHYVIISRSKLWESWFLFSECRYKRKKFRRRSLVGHCYVSLNVTQQNLFETSVIFFQRHLFVLKKYWKNVVNFSILCYILWTIVVLSSPYSIFPLLCISKWGNDIP